MALLVALPGLGQAQTTTTESADEPGAEGKAKTLDTIHVKGVRGLLASGQLRDMEIISTQSIGAKDIRQVNAGNLNEAVDKHPGVAVQVECSICNVRNVVLNNLPGRFTTLLIDGIPIYSSVSSAYGLDSVGVDGVERIDIARGAATSLIAPEALSGVVNVITKRPDAPEAAFSTQGGTYGARRADAYLARPFSGGAASLVYSFQNHPQVDADHNGFSEYTGYARRLFGLAWFLDDMGGFDLHGRLDHVSENRHGGAMGKDYSAIMASYGDGSNPFDWSAGPHGSPSRDGWIDPATGLIVPWTDGRGGLSEIIFTRRWQGTLTAKRALGGGVLVLDAGYAHHDQDSFYEGAYYEGRQHQGYLGAKYLWTGLGWSWTTGVDYRYEDLHSHGFSPALADAGLPLGDPGRVVGVDDYRYRTPAAFVSAHRDWNDGKVELDASLRYDRNNVFGGIVTPRLDVLWRHTEVLSSRFAIGTGFRAPTSFFEQDHGILDTGLIVRRIDHPEQSQNASYTLAWSSDRLTWRATVDYTRIRHFAMLSPGAVCFNSSGAIFDPPSDGACPPGQDATLFGEASKPVIVRGLDGQLSYRWTPAFETTVGAEAYSYTFQPGTLVFSRPDSRVFVKLDYDRGGFDAFLRAVWTSSQDLARFYDYADTPRYNFDGTPKLNRSPSFWQVDLNLSYSITPQVTVFGGVENLTNFYQAKVENFLWIDPEGGYDVTHIWGPSRPRTVYAGVRVKW